MNTMFFGQYKYNLDEKGRIVIPSEFRKELGSTVICNKGIENCITIYKESDFNKLVNDISELPFNKSDTRKFNRYFFASVFKKEIDSQGRINIDLILIKHADILKECVIVGVGNAIEIWAKESWDEIEKARIDEYDEISERISFKE